MRSLLDISMLLALFDRAHLHHGLAVRWWAGEMRHGWASCPLTENGFLRIISQRSYPRPVPLADAMQVLRRQVAQGGHAFWPDDVSLLDGAVIDPARLLGPRQLTDVYLLALATKHGGRLATLDRGISLNAARGAEEANLVVIG